MSSISSIPAAPGSMAGGSAQRGAAAAESFFKKAPAPATTPDDIDPSLPPMVPGVVRKATPAPAPVSTRPAPASSMNKPVIPAVQSVPTPAGSIPTAWGGHIQVPKKADKETVVVPESPTMLPAKVPAPGIHHQQPKFTMVGGIPRPGNVVVAGGQHGSRGVRPLNATVAATSSGSNGGITAMAVPTVAKPPDFTAEQVEYIRKMSKENPIPRACPVFRFGFGGKVVTIFPSRIPGSGGGFAKRPSPLRVFPRMMDLIDPTISNSSVGIDPVVTGTGANTESLYRYKLDDVSTFVDMMKGFPSAHGNAGPLSSAGSNSAGSSVSTPLLLVTQIKQFINQQVSKLERTRIALQHSQRQEEQSEGRGRGSRGPSRPASGATSPVRASSSSSIFGHGNTRSDDFVIVPVASPTPSVASVASGGTVTPALGDTVVTEDDSAAVDSSNDNSMSAADLFASEMPKMTHADSETDKNGEGGPKSTTGANTKSEVGATVEQDKTETEMKGEAASVAKDVEITVSTSTPSTTTVTPTSVSLSATNTDSAVAAAAAAISSVPDAGAEASTAATADSTASILQRLEMEIRMWNLIKLSLDFGGSVQSETGAKADGSPESKIVHVISAAIGLLSSAPVPGMGRGPSPGVMGKMPAHMMTPTPTTAKSMRNDPMFLQSPVSAGSCIDDSVMSSYLSFLKTQNVECSTSSSSSYSSSLQQTSVATAFAHIENLLLHGQHEEAVAIAVSTQQWGLAMLISSCVGKTKNGVDLYQSTVAQFSKTFFPAASPLNVLALTYSNQVTPDVYTLGGTGAGEAGAVAMEELRSNAELWSRHFCAIMANKSVTWKPCLRRLGDGLLHRTLVDVQAAAKSKPHPLTAANNAYYVGFLLFCYLILVHVQQLILLISYMWLFALIFCNVCYRWLCVLTLHIFAVGSYQVHQPAPPSLSQCLHPAAAMVMIIALS